MSDNGADQGIHVVDGGHENARDRLFAYATAQRAFLFMRLGGKARHYSFVAVLNSFLFAIVGSELHKCDLKQSTVPRRELEERQVRAFHLLFTHKPFQSDN